MSLNAKRKRKSILVLHLIWFLCDADAHTMAGVLNKLLQATQATAAVAPPSFSILIKLHFWMIFFRAVSFPTNCEKWTWVQMLNTSHKVVPIFFLLTAQNMFFRLHQATAICVFAYLCHSNHTIYLAMSSFSLSLSVSHRHRSYFFF